MTWVLFAFLGRILGKYGRGGSAWSMRDIKFDFGTVSERDMDVMFLHAFAEDRDFLRIFTDKTDLPGADYEIAEIDLSKADGDGESDITVIIESSGVRYGLLIEDKVDAIDMPGQPERYLIRGQKGVKNKDYEAFYSFILCPEKYYKNNAAARKYPYAVMYEEIREYFKDKKNPQYTFYYQQISQAIEKAKRPSKVEINKKANQFYRKYKDYQEEHYPQLDLVTKRESNGYWAQYRTRFGSVYLYHKISDGKIDLTFNKAAEHMDKLEKVAVWLRENKIVDVVAIKTKKAGALRYRAPKLNMKIPFEENDPYDIEECFKNILKLIGVANVFGLAGEVSDLKD